MKSRLLSAVSVCATTLVLSNSANAALIDVNDFDGTANVTTYNGLGLNWINPGGTVIGGNTYDTDGGNSGDLRYGAFHDGSSAKNPVCYEAECVATNTSAGWMDIQLGSASRLVGAWVASSNLWSAKAEFFDISNNLLGQHMFSGGNTENVFVGWQSDTALISRVRFTDLSNDNKILMVDNFTTQANYSVLPVPAAVWLFSSGLLGLVGLARRKSS